MKFNIIAATIITLTFTSKAFGGGQIGSGGNGCILETGEWKSIEELLYPSMFSRNLSRYKKAVLPEVLPSSLKRIALSDYQDHNQSFHRLNRLARKAPRVHKVLTDFATLFESSYLINDSVVGLFDADIIFLYYKPCVTYTPALMTFHDGAIVFFRSVWNKLSDKTAEVILVHETLRLAQMFHPAFENMDDWELQNIVANIFDERINVFKPTLLSKYENFLNKECKPTYTADDSEFKKKIQDAICSGDLNADEINNWRRWNFVYRQKVEKNLKTLFLEN